MTISRLPNGRWRARVWVDGRDISVGQVLGTGAGSYRTKKEAQAAYNKAHELLRGGFGDGSVTVAIWWEQWTTDPAYARPKESTNRHNRERTKAFADKYGKLPLARVTRATVAEWRRGGRNDGSIPSLRAMWNDAMRADLIDRNPFAKLGISKSRGNRDVRPPSLEIVAKLIVAARQQAGPGFAAWLTVAAYTGMRPGEIDALRWDAIDFERGRILVREQWSAKVRTFSLPKNGRRREAPLTPPAREALLALPRESEFCFVNLRGNHWTAASRAYHWKATRAAVGYTGSLYLATRHAAGDYMTNILGLSAEDVAIALGHTDGGYLVRTLYGHLDDQLALDRVISAYEARKNVIPLPKREREAG